MEKIDKGNLKLVNDRILTLFNFTGHRNDIHCSLYLPFSGIIEFKIEGSLASPGILAAIMNSKNPNEIKDIKVSPMTAMMLYFEGIITTVAIQNAIVEKNMIIFEEIKFSGLKNKLAIIVVPDMVI